MKKIILIVIIFVMASVSIESISKEEPAAKPSLLVLSPPVTTPFELQKPDVEIYPDNTQPILDKGGSSILNITIIGNVVTGGTSISLGYEIISAIYGNDGENHREINLTFNPQQVVFPKTVNRTDTPYKLYSHLTIKTAPTSPDADYFFTIKNKNFNVYAQPIHLRVGKGVLPERGSGPLRLRPINPDSGAKNVPITTNISASFGRATIDIGKLDIKPEVEISKATAERDRIGTKYTFYPTKPLQPNTTYTVTITIETNGTYTGSTQWQFTTTNESGETAKTPEAVPTNVSGFGIGMVVIVALMIYLFRKTKWL